MCVGLYLHWKPLTYLAWTWTWHTWLGLPHPGFAPPSLSHMLCQDPGIRWENRKRSHYPGIVMLGCRVLLLPTDNDASSNVLLWNINYKVWFLERGSNMILCWSPNPAQLPQEMSLNFSGFRGQNLKMALPGGYLEDRIWVLWNFCPNFGHLTLFRWLKFEILTLVI